MFSLFNFHFHLTVQEIKVLLAVGSNDAGASVDEVVRAVIGGGAQPAVVGLGAVFSIGSDPGDSYPRK